VSATYPVLGYVNFLARSTTVLTSADVVDGSSIRNLVDPNMSAVADLGLGDDRAFAADFGAALQPTLLCARLRGEGWHDVTGLRLRLSNSADLSAPEKDTTFPAYFPSPWPDEMPVRPVVIATWDAVAGCRYAGLNALRTTGEEPLEIAYAYLGEHVELHGSGPGYRVWGSSIGRADHSRKVSTGLGGHAIVAGAVERHATVKVSASSTAHVETERFPKLLYASAARPVVYFARPASVDPIVVQSQALIATLAIGDRIELTHDGYEWWEQTFPLEEIL